MTTIAEPEKLTLGSSLPPNDPHGVSVHLPKWADTVGWAAREPRVLSAMNTGYPRFFIPRVADQLAMALLDMQQGRNTTPGPGETRNRLAILIDSFRHAQCCRQALPKWNSEAGGDNAADVQVYAVSWDGFISSVEAESAPPDTSQSASNIGEEDIFLVSYDAELGAAAKAFWQHTGFGISSRGAAHWLAHAPFLPGTAPSTPYLAPNELSSKVDEAKMTLKMRIAAGQSSAPDNLIVSPSEVFLFPTGMTAITETAAAVQTLRPSRPTTPYRVAVFGFLYVDTYKTLTRLLAYHPTLYHFSTPDIDALEATLPTTPLDLLITEFPGNPLLQSPDLARLRALSLKHNFALVVDDTVGTHAALRGILASCDAVCTSLTKMFSGGCNVMGGAVTLNKGGRWYGGLKGALAGCDDGVVGRGGSGSRGENGYGEGENGAGDGKRDGGVAAAALGSSSWYWEDVLLMEENSRDFPARTRLASRNAERVAEMLRRSPAVAEVFYPKGSPTQALYERCMREEEELYGFLLSVRLTSPARAVAFYDALDVAKGPSLGTNFTLCCAYTLLAHYKELAWAAEYGVVEDLVRISVGLEEWAWLEARVHKALKAAEVIA